MLDQRHPDSMASMVLGVLLEDPHVHWSHDELVRHMTKANHDFSRRDDVHVALDDLAANGLIHRHGPFVFPTRAATRARAVAE